MNETRPTRIHPSLGARRALSWSLLLLWTSAGIAARAQLQDLTPVGPELRLALPSPRPEIRFLRPFPGESLTNDQQLTIRAFVDGPDPRSLAPSDIRITARGEGGTLVIAAGIAAVEGREITAVWDLQTVPLGPYTISIEATAGPFTVRTETRVKVRRPPTTSLRLVDLQLVDGDIEATFAAEANAEDNAHIDRYAWKPDLGRDLEITSEPRFTTAYRPIGSPHFPSLEVFDDRGGTALASCTLTIPEDPTPILQEIAACRSTGRPSGCLELLTELCTPNQPEACGCERMAVFDRAGSTTGIFCRPDPAPGTFYSDQCEVLPDPQGLGCPSNHQAFRCPVNRQIPTPIRDGLTYGFEIIAFLEAGSTPGACEEGQYAKASALIDNALLPPIFTRPRPSSGRQELPRLDGTSFVFDVVDNGDPYPPYFRQLDPRFGADDLARPEPEKKRYFGRRLQWWDKPGILDLSVLERGRVFGEFITFVRGSTGKTCWCRFTIENFFDARKPGDTGAGLQLVDGLRCSRIQ